MSKHPVGSFVRFAHEEIPCKVHRVTAIEGDMVELEDMAGQFAEHIFFAVPAERVYTPITGPVEYRAI